MVFIERADENKTTPLEFECVEKKQVKIDEEKEKEWKKSPTQTTNLLFDQYYNFHGQKKNYVNIEENE